MFSTWRGAGGGQVVGPRLARGAASAPGKSARSTPAGRGSAPGRTPHPLLPAGVWVPPWGGGVIRWRGAEMLDGAASEQPLASRGPGRPNSAEHSQRGPAPPGGAPSRPCAARTGAKTGSLTPAVSASRSNPLLSSLLSV